MKNFQNLGELVFYLAKNFDNNEFLNYKKDGKWVRYSCDDFAELVFIFAVGLKKSGFCKGQRLVLSLIHI